MDRLELMLEAERRGILPPEHAELLGEARKRGLVPKLEAQAPAGGAPDAIDRFLASRGRGFIAGDQASSREPSNAEGASEWTQRNLPSWAQASPEYLARVGHEATAPVRVAQGAAEPIMGAGILATRAAGYPQTSQAIADELRSQQEARERDLSTLRSQHVYGGVEPESTIDWGRAAGNAIPILAAPGMYGAGAGQNLLARIGLGAASGAAEGAANTAAAGGDARDIDASAIGHGMIGGGAALSPYLASFARVALPSAAVGAAASHVPVAGNYLAWRAGEHGVVRGAQNVARTSSSPGAAYIAAAIGEYGNEPRTEREWQDAYRTKLDAVRQAASYYGQSALGYF